MGGCGGRGLVDERLSDGHEGAGVRVWVVGLVEAELDEFGEDFFEV